MKCMLSMSVFIQLRRLRIGEGSLKGDDIDGCFYILFYFHIISSMQSRPLVPRQTWRLTGTQNCGKTLVGLRKTLVGLNWILVGLGPHRAYRKRRPWDYIDFKLSRCWCPIWLQACLWPYPAIVRPNIPRAVPTWASFRISREEALSVWCFFLDV